MTNKTSKWILDATKAAFYGKEDNGNNIDEILERVDSLLRKAMYSVDDEKLHDDIEKELEKDE